jgi:DNA-binding response OmpR family regulator
MTPHLLVAGSDPALRDLLRLALTHIGYEVTAAACGPSAAAALAAGRFSAAVFDQSLAGQSGVAVAEAARVRGVRTPILILSGALSPADLPAGDHRTQLLAKPFGLHALEAAVRSLTRFVSIGRAADR